jgi:hypothetical protein
LESRRQSEFGTKAGVKSYQYGRMIPYPQIFLVLATIIVVSIVAHIFVRRIFLASAIAGIISGTIFVIAAFIQDGHLYAVPFLLGGLYAFVFALFVGVFFYFGLKYLR